jgi:nucleoside transporter
MSADGGKASGPLPRLNSYFQLAALSFVQMMAGGIWLVPLSRVLTANGYGGLTAYAYATTAAAAFVSPLVFGAMADRHASPTQVLRGLSVACAAAMGLASYAIGHGWDQISVLLLIEVYALVSAPTSSIASTIIFSRLKNSQRQFGPIRAAGTFGWMCGCWLVSGLGVDASPGAGFAGASIWILLAIYSYALPEVPPPPAGKVTLVQRMGWDALLLLKQHDHRGVFLTTALFSIPLAAFYPYTPLHLQHLGFQRTAAWMTLGQVTEIVAMFSLAYLFLAVRLKWIFAAGLTFGVLRYILCAFDTPYLLLAGVTLHGCSYTFFFVTSQIYLNERIDAAWRARAQALLTLMTSGLGNLAGYLGCGLWFRACSQHETVQWPLFWSCLAVSVAAVFVFFLIAYHGRSSGFRRPSTGEGIVE